MTAPKREKQSHHLNERVAIIEVDNNYLHKALDELKQGQKEIIQEMRNGFLEVKKEFISVRDEFASVRSEMQQGFSDVRKEIADVRKENWAQMRWIMGFMLAVIASPYIAPEFVKLIKAMLLPST